MNTDSLPWGVIAVILLLVVVAIVIVKRNKSSSASSAAAPTGIVASITAAAATAKTDLSQHAEDLRDALTRHGIAIAAAHDEATAAKPAETAQIAPGSTPAAPAVSQAPAAASNAAAPAVAAAAAPEAGPSTPVQTQAPVAPAPAADAPLPPAQVLPNGARVDPIVPAGTPGTVVLPKTEHVLSVPRADLGEGFLGYAMRVNAQAHGDYKTVGGLLISQSALHSFKTGAPEDWPAMVDEFFNTRAYMTADELARQQQAATGWGDVYTRMQQEAARAGAPASIAAAPVDVPVLIDQQ